jgi:hypothetical protein
LPVPLICGAIVTLGAGGALLKHRIIASALCAAAAGALSPYISAVLSTGPPLGISDLIANSVWRLFIFTIFSVVGLLIVEINLPEPSEFGSRNAEVGK